MKRTRYTAEQIIRKLKTAEQLMIVQGKTVVQVCRLIEVSHPTYHPSTQLYRRMQAQAARRQPQLEKENARLMKLWA